jgi:carnitine-CoA ligase
MTPTDSPAAPADDCTETAHGVLEQAARERPDDVAVRFTAGRAFTLQELLEEAHAVGAGLQEWGLQRGDRVAVFAGNLEHYAPIFFGASLAGAVLVPFNAGWKGGLLEYTLNDSGPRVIFVGAEQWPRLAEVLPRATTLECVVVLDGEVPEEATAFASFVRHGEQANVPEQFPWDHALILYTSGTTGPSKGIMFSHRMMIRGFAEPLADYVGFRPGDVLYTVLPLFHGNALFGGLLAAIVRSGAVVIGPRFSVTTFWQEVCDSGATLTSLLGMMVPLLWNAPSTPAERQHQVRTALAVPSPVDYYDEFAERFNVQLVEGYGLTDIGVPIGMKPGDRRPGSCGRALPDWEIQLVDEYDRPVPVGEQGECVLRPKVPFLMALGYWNKPEATAAAWQNLWAHSGDYLRMDEEGWYYFVDRKKDAIRRGGENISSHEVEQVILGHPAVLEAAVYAVPSELSEDDVMAAVVFQPGLSVDPGDLHAYCSDRLAHFSVPRYIVVRESLPKTQNERVQKAVLRDEGIKAPGVWDSGSRARRK